MPKNTHYWGIKGWDPTWYDTVAKFLSVLKQVNVYGKIISSTFTLWDDDEWFEDAPVIIVIDGVKLELCANQIGLFSLTVNTIDT